MALVDELAHTNAPGSKHEKRWQDVEELLDHGITVISTLNVQHLESLADIVERITGAPVRERIPDEVVRAADEVELVDMSPHALRQRIRHGNVYPPERAEQALAQFFREGNLTALRELALREVSHAVEQDLEEYMREHAIDASWPAGERVMVCVNAGADAAAHPPGLADGEPTAGRLARRLRRDAGLGEGVARGASVRSRRTCASPRTSAPRWCARRVSDVAAALVERGARRERRQHRRSATRAIRWLRDLLSGSVTQRLLQARRRTSTCW